MCNIIPENYQEEYQMKKFTRMLCLVLCLVMLLPTVVACSTKDGTYGAQINMYLADEIHNLDPAYAHLDSGSAKLIGLLFEGLMYIDEKGKLHLERAGLTAYAHGDYFALGKKIGSFGFSTKKKQGKKPQGKRK